MRFGLVIPQGWRRAVHHRLPGDKAAFVARANELAERYGDRFNPPASRCDVVTTHSNDPRRACVPGAFASARP